MLLVGGIGGTNARFAIAEPGKRATSKDEVNAAIKHAADQ